jgi:hypothetical protein
MRNNATVSVFVIVHFTLIPPLAPCCQLGRMSHARWTHCDYFNGYEERASGKRVKNQEREDSHARFTEEERMRHVAATLESDYHTQLRTTMSQAERAHAIATTTTAAAVSSTTHTTPGATQ